MEFRLKIDLPWDKGGSRSLEINSVTDTWDSLLGTSSWCPGAPPIMESGSLFTSTLLPDTRSLVTSWFLRILACCPPAENVKWISTGKKVCFVFNWMVMITILWKNYDFIYLPIEYLAFLGDEIIMYCCCSAGLVIPRLVVTCFGEAWVWAWLWAGGAELTTAVWWRKVGNGCWPAMLTICWKINQLINKLFKKSYLLPHYKYKKAP